MPYTQLGIKRYLYIQTKSFQALGIKITADELNWRAFWKTCVSGAATMTLLITMGLYSWRHMRDLMELTEAIAPFFELVLVVWKVGIFLSKHGRMVALVKRTHQLSLQAAKTNFKILVEENLKDGWLSGFYYASITIAATFAMLTPVVKSTIDYMRTGEFRMQPFFKGSYPFKDTARPPYCLFIYLCTGCMAYFGVYVTLSIESLYSWLMHNIVAHFRILQQQLKDFNESTSEADLRKWISYHQQNLALAEELNTIYSPVVFAQFALNSIQIVLVAYQMLQMPKLTELLFLMIFLLAVVIQPTIYCYGGQRVEDESELVALFIYKYLDWQNWSRRSRQLMQLPIMRAQKSCKFTGIFFVANLRLYLWVIRTTASYMTLLWSIK